MSGVTNNTNLATVALFSSTGTASVGNDPVSGLPTITLPQVVPTFVSGNQCTPGDVAMVRAHDVQSTQVIDATFGAVIDIVPANEAHQYKAQQQLVWLRTDGVVVQGSHGSAPNNTTTPAQWLYITSTNGAIVGRVPVYQ